MDGTRDKPGVGSSIAAGVLGGIAGSAVMVAFNHVLGATGVGQRDVGLRHRRRHAAAAPNDTDGTISDEPASIKVAADAVEAVIDTRLPEGDRRVLGLLGHHAFGALAGGIYGLVAARADGVTTGGGAPYGAFVWLAAVETGLPLTGLTRPPHTYAASRHAASLATHVVFGLTLEAVRSALTRNWRSRR